MAEYLTDAKDLLGLLAESESRNTELTAERDALRREVEAARRLLDSAQHVTFVNHSRMIWTSTNGIFKWEISTDIRKNNYKGRYDTALEAFAALEGESR